MRRHRLRFVDRRRCGERHGMGEVLPRGRANATPADRCPADGVVTPPPADPARHRVAESRRSSWPASQRLARSPVRSPPASAPQEPRPPRQRSQTPSAASRTPTDRRTSILSTRPRRRTGRSRILRHELSLDLPRCLLLPITEHDEPPRMCRSPDIRGVAARQSDRRAMARPPVRSRRPRRRARPASS
jgi:hypothetical protein